LADKIVGAFSQFAITHVSSRTIGRGAGQVATGGGLIGAFARCTLCCATSTTTRQTRIHDVRFTNYQVTVPRAKLEFDTPSSSDFNANMVRFDPPGMAR